MDRVFSDEYVEYMKSPEWKGRRQWALFRAGNRCEECGIVRSEEDPLDVHHLTYRRFLKEREEDLQVLCRLCHDRKEIEKRRRGYPAGKCVGIQELIDEYMTDYLIPRIVSYVEEPAADACPF